MELFTTMERERPTPQKVVEAQVDMLEAQATIDTGKRVLAAAGLPIDTPQGTADLTINVVAVKLPALWPDNILIKLKGTFFDTAVGTRPNFARMCG